MFNYRFKQIVLILAIGIGLGILVPVLMQMQKLPMTNPSGNNVLADESESINKGNLARTGNYSVQVQDGSLSILQGEPQTGQILLSGLDVSHWPKEMQSMVTQIEFHSLDEVQSFIDSMSEDLWLE